MCNVNLEGQYGMHYESVGNYVETDVYIRLIS